MNGRVILPLALKLIAVAVKGIGDGIGGKLYSGDTARLIIAVLDCSTLRAGNFFYAPRLVIAACCRIV